MRNYAMRNQRMAAANARWRNAEATREDRPERDEPADCRRPIDLDLTCVGGQRWQMVPRPGMHSWSLVGADGKVARRAALKTLLRGLADGLPRMLAPRRLRDMG